MPTYEALPRFIADLDRLTPDQRRAFHRVVTRAFVPDLRVGRFRQACASREYAWPQTYMS